MLKHEADHDLVDAVRAVGRGDSFLTNAAQRALVRTWMEDDSAGPREPLTPREQEVLKLIAEAHTNREIGAILHLAEKTVESHRGEHPAQARHARPRRARALRDPARAGRAVGPAPGSRSSAAARRQSRVRAAGTERLVARRERRRERSAGDGRHAPRSASVGDIRAARPAG